MSVRYAGTLGFSNRAVVFNNQKAFGKGLNFSQQLGGSFSLKKLSMSTHTSYSVSNNNNVSSLYSVSGFQALGIGQIAAPAFFTTTNFRATVDAHLRLKKLTLNTGLGYSKNHNDSDNTQSVGDISDFNMNLSIRVTVKKSYFINLSAAKRVNYGYALSNTNPLIIHLGMERSFFKDKALSLNIRGNDLLGQGNNISRTVTGNTIIDSRNKQQTRVFSLNLNYKLSRFGGRHFRVDADEPFE